MFQQISEKEVFRNVIIRFCRLRLDRKDISAIFIMLEVIKKALMTQNNLITIVTMWNKVNELSRENLPQQQIVTSSFHQCQQGSASNQCQCYSSNILVNANPSHPTPIRNRPTLLCHFATKTVPAKRSKRYKPHQNAHFAPTKSFYRYEIANTRHPTTLPTKNTKVNVIPHSHTIAQHQFSNTLPTKKNGAIKAPPILT